MPELDVLLLEELLLLDADELLEDDELLDEELELLDEELLEEELVLDEELLEELDPLPGLSGSLVAPPQEHKTASDMQSVNFRNIVLSKSISLTQLTE